MANELKVTTGLSFEKGGAKSAVESSTKNITVSGTDYEKRVVEIGTTDETISLGDIGTVGFVHIKNLDGTNYVDFGSDGTNYFVRCKATETAVFRCASAAIHTKANTAACKIEIMLVED